MCKACGDKQPEREEEVEEEEEEPTGHRKRFRAGASSAASASEPPAAGSVEEQVEWLRGNVEDMVTAGQLAMLRLRPPKISYC